VVKTVLGRDNGIEERRLAVETLQEVFEIDPDTLQRRFEHHAPLLASEAGRQALQRAGLGPDAMDAVIVSTCTGYLCPGLSGYVVEQLGLRPTVQCFDLVGQGCAAALPNWQLADALLAGGRGQHVLSICVEVCSAAMYLDNEPGILISACLFGDGAGAAVLSRNRPGDGRKVEWRDSVSLLKPEARQALRFETRAGMLRNVLTRAVPRIAGEHVEQTLGTALQRNGLGRTDISNWIMHAGGRDVLLAIEERLSLPPQALHYSREALRLLGNLSSAFLYFVLESALADEAEGGWWWMSSFGAGFSCHGALLSVE
jgi:alkylresorcinol/alkylpyrone synthase